MTKNQRRKNKLYLIRNSRIFKVLPNDGGFHGFEAGTLVRWWPLDEHRYPERREGRESLNCIEIAKVPYPLRQWVPSNQLM